MTTISYHDFSAIVFDYSGQPLEVPVQNQQQKSLATYLNFAVSVLRATYEDENLHMEAKTYRSTLCEKICVNPTSVALTFADKVILSNLIAKGTRSLLICERFTEFLSRTDIVVNPPPVISPIEEKISDAVAEQVPIKDNLPS
jgi:hypothetical protein